MKHFKFIATALFAFTFASPAFAQQGFNDGSVKAAVGKAKVQKVTTAKDTAPQNRKWTVMVYMNSKNDLEFGSILDINEMESVGSTNDVAFVVEAGIMKEHDSYFERSDNAWTGTKRFYITKSDVGQLAGINMSDVQMETLVKGSKVNSEAVADLGQTDMGDFRNVIKFVDWAQKTYPADNYMLVLWSHGFGVMDHGKANVPQGGEGTKGISPDHETGNYIRTQQLTQILKTVKGVDVIATDACLMQMAEVIYHMYSDAKFIVGSEEPLPPLGYNYVPIARALTANPNITPKQLSVLMVQSVGDFYKDHNQLLTISAVDSSKFPNFVNALNAWADAVMAVPEEQIRPALIKARNEALRIQAYGGILAEINNKRVLDNKLNIPKPQQQAPQGGHDFDTVWQADEEPLGMHITNFADLGVFVNLIAANTNNGRVHEASRTLLDSMRAMVLAKRTSGKTFDNQDFEKAGGIGIGVPRVAYLIPDAAVESHLNLETPYLEYPFVKRTKWGKFYTWFDQIARP